MFYSQWSLLYAEWVGHTYPAKKEIIMARIREGEVQVSFAVDERLRDLFVQECRRNDTSGSRELRKFMRQYVRASKEKEHWLTINGDSDESYSIPEPEKKKKKMKSDDFDMEG